MTANTDEIPATIERRNVEIISPEEGTSNQEIATEGDAPPSARQKAVKILFGLAFVAFVAYVIVDSATNMHFIHAIEAFLEWVEVNPVGGVFAFVVGTYQTISVHYVFSRLIVCTTSTLTVFMCIVYFVATILFLPGSILTLGAGFVFAMAFGLGGGVILGTLAVFLGASAGAMVAFLIGRYLLRDQMLKLTKKYVIFEALEAALAKNGLRIFALLRLSPLVPFNVINYIAGVTSVSFRDYAISLFAILPGTILFVFLGASAGSLTESATSGGDNSTITIIVAVVGAVFGILAIVMTARYAKRELQRVTEERRQLEEESKKDHNRKSNVHSDEESGKDRLGESATEFCQDNSAGSREDARIVQM